MALQTLREWGITMATLASASIWASSQVSAQSDWDHSPIVPVQKACMSSPFGPRILPDHPTAGSFHNGIDLPAPVGAPVIAVGPGFVIRVQRRGIGGLEMLVQHDGFIGVYSHLGSVAPVIADGHRDVFGGERLASVGRTGLSFGPHLYFGMIVNGHPVDPAPFLGVKSCGEGTASIVDGRLRPTRLFAQHQPK